MRSSRRCSVALSVIFLVVACDSSLSPSVIGQVQPIERITVSAKALSLVVGQERQLDIEGSPSRVSWQTDNPDVASVSVNGFVTARSPGSARVIARGRSAADTAMVRVRLPIRSLRLTADSITVAADKTARLLFLALDA